MSASATRRNSGSNGQEQSASVNLASAVSQASFSHSTDYGEISVEGWYLVALAALVLVVVL